MGNNKGAIKMNFEQLKMKLNDNNYHIGNKDLISFFDRISEYIADEKSLEMIKTDMLNFFSKKAYDEKNIGSIIDAFIRSKVIDHVSDLLAEWLKDNYNISNLCYNSYIDATKKGYFIFEITPHDDTKENLVLLYENNSFSVLTS